MRSPCFPIPMPTDLLKITIKDSFKNIYVHLPFCQIICHYCDFYVAKVKNTNQDRFFQALDRELALWDEIKNPIETIYLGGGTPSESPVTAVEHFLQQLLPKAHPDVEVTMEVNPTSVTEEKLQQWRSMGINRLSMGVQSLTDKHLKRLGRGHSSQEALHALHLATKYFKNISVDLIYGIPEQSISELKADILKLCAFPIAHLSAYTLTLKSEHFLYTRLPSGDIAMDQANAICQTLESLGWNQYEVSNFSRPGCRSRHNENYWSGNSYLGLGPSAHSFNGESMRWKNVSNWKQYCEELENNELPIVELETLSEKEKITEYLLTKFRHINGFHNGDFHERFGVDLFLQKQDVFREMEAIGLGKKNKEHWKPTFRGLMLGEEIILKLL